MNYKFYVMIYFHTFIKKAGFLKGGLTMPEKLSHLVFILSFVCLGLFLLLGFSPLYDFYLNKIGHRPFSLLLLLTVLVFLLSVLVLKKVQNWQSGFHVVFSIILTLFLSSVLAIIVFFGSQFR